MPSCLDLALQVRAIPQKRADKPLIDWLGPAEMQAILDAPDTTTVGGLRDRAMLYVCYAAGLRVSELTALTLDSLSSPQLETIRILRKGRRERELPLWTEVKTVLQQWLDVRPLVNNRYLFLNARGRAMSSDGFAYRFDLHVATAAKSKPSLNDKRIDKPACHQARDRHGDPACHRGYPERLALARTCRRQDHRSVPSRQSSQETGNPRCQHTAVDPVRDIPRRQEHPYEPSQRDLRSEVNAE